MGKLPGSQNGSMLDWVDDVPPNIKAELKNRYDELSRLEQEQLQMGTTVPQLYGSLSRFIANPSTVSVETYKRMVDTDEQVGAGIDFLNLCLIARWGDYKHPNKDIEVFVRRAIEQMEGSWHQNIDEMVSAEWNGFSVTEQEWHYKHDFDGAPAYVPKKLTTYPPLTIVFAVNRHGEVLPDGIFQYQRFHNTFFNSYVFGLRGGELDGFRPDLFASIGDYPYPVRIAADLTYLTVKIPKNKVIHLTGSTTGKFNNPYGRSNLRRAYKHWVLKDAFLKMWVVAADRKGTPLLVGYADPNTTLIQQNQKTTGNDTNVMRADQALAHTMKNVHNSSFITLPGKKGETYEIDAIQVQGDMNVFKDGLEYFDKKIMRAILIPELLMSGEGGGLNGSLGSEQKKTFNNIIDGKLKVYKQAILDQWVRKIIAYNFPVSMWEKHGYGQFLLEEYDPEVMEKLSNIYGNLTDRGYMDASDQQDFEYVRKKILQEAPKRQAPQPVEPINVNADPNDPNAAANESDNDPNKPGNETAKDNPQKEEKEDTLPPNYRI